MGFNDCRPVITCCKGCQERYPGCHAQCEAYKKQRAEYDAFRQERSAKIAASRSLNEYKFDFGHRVTKKQVYRNKFRKGR